MGGGHEWMDELIFNYFQRFHYIFGIYRQPGLVSYRREFAHSCLTTFLINNKNGLIGAANAATTMNPKELEYFLWVYRIVDTRNGNVGKNGNKKIYCRGKKIGFITNFAN